MISFSTEEPNIFVLLNFANDLINDTAPEALHVSGFKVHLSPVVSYNVTKVVKNKEMTLNGARFSVVLKRVYSNHVLHTYIPSLMLCIASTCSLFVPSDLIPGRMGLCITTFLSIISLFNGAKYVLYSDCIHYISTVLCFFRSSWPNTSYMKATDLWTLFCYLGVFYSLTEYCIVLYLTKWADWEIELKTQKNKDKKLFQKPEDERIQQRENRMKLLKLAGKIEFASRIFVPLYFLVFVLLYWIICLSKSQ